MYFSDDEGIKRMNLDGTGVETLTAEWAAQMVYYGGALYFTGGSDGYLYRMAPGAEPELIDGSGYVSYLTREGSALCYGQYFDGSDRREIPLSGYDPDECADAGMAAPATVSRSRSFRMEIAFSGEMDSSADWPDYVYLVNGEGNAVPLHLLWSEDGKTLTVRSKDCVADMENLTLYVMAGAPAANGSGLAETQGMRVEIVSDYVFPAGGE